jgi:hypothetical protein
MRSENLDSVSVTCNRNAIRASRWRNSQEVYKVVETINGAGELCIGQVFMDEWRQRSIAKS